MLSGAASHIQSTIHSRWSGLHKYPYTHGGTGRHLPHHIARSSSVGSRILLVAGALGSVHEASPSQLEQQAAGGGIKAVQSSPVLQALLSVQHAATTAVNPEQSSPVPQALVSVQH